jgi:hypothetical protein
LNSYGLRISNASNTGDEIDAEMYASHYGGPPLRTGFYGYLATGGFYVGDVDTFDLAVNTGAVRVAYKASTKVVTLYYDTDTSNGYTWVSYGSFGIAGSGGSTSNTDWSMGPGDRFDIAVYGFSANMTVSTGTVYGDNFLTSGGVAP